MGKREMRRRGEGAVQNSARIPRFGAARQNADPYTKTAGHSESESRAPHGFRPRKG
jgi:hypothetical protein